MIKALSAPLTTDLMPLSTYLWQRGIAHKITEERGQQIIWVGEQNDATLVKHYFHQWSNGMLSTPSSHTTAQHNNHYSEKKPQFPSRLPFIEQWKSSPVTLAIIIISIVVTLLMSILPNNSVIRALIFIGPNQAVQWLTQHGVAQSGSANFHALTSIWLQTLASGQVWRLITPIFLHFSLMHIAFNAAMFFFFGQRIEARHGIKTLLFLIIATGLLSNIVQYFSGSLSGIVFGGLSGVIYGLIGFCWVRAKETHDGYGIPKGIYAFMIGWLILGYTGILDGLIGTLANGAHAGGLIAGMIAGFLSAKKRLYKE